MIEFPPLLRNSQQKGERNGEYFNHRSRGLLNDSRGIQMSKILVLGGGTAGKDHGLGLGLALSRQTVLDHGGDIWTEPAKGARFVICLPLQSIDGGIQRNALAERKERNE